MATRMTHEEEELLESVERGEWHSIPDTAQESQRYQQYATATFEKNRRINIRLSRKDLEALQTLALEEGLPYQTMIASILHKYVNGRLVDRPRSITESVG